MSRLLFSVIFVPVLLLAAGKKIPLHTTSNDVVELTATAVIDREGIRNLLGTDLDGHYIVLQVQLAPQDEKKVNVVLHDFRLMTDKDGERAYPFTPSQIAGQGAMVIASSEGSRGGGSDGNGPVLGGPLGGRPRRMGGDGTSIGGSDSQASAKMTTGDKDQPLLDVLKEKMLPQKEITSPVSGLLYFAMEKQKLKDLELTYTTSEGKLTLRFR